MPPGDFESLADGAMSVIRDTLGTKPDEALYLPKSGGQHSIKGVFDDRVQEVDPDTEVVVSSNAFTFGIRLKDLPVTPQKGDKLVIKQVQYRVVEAREDGVPGVSAVLVLHKVV